jgi:hypothetical protein
MRPGTTANRGCPRLLDQEPHPPQEMAPAGVLVLRVMATRMATGMCCCVRVSTAVPPPLFPGGRADHPLAPSSAHDAMSRTTRFRSRPIRPRRQLVNVLPRAASQPRHGCCGVAASPVPTGRPFHVGGRSSPEPAKPTVRSSPCQGFGTVPLRSAFPRQGRAKELSPVSRETLQAASTNVGNPISVLRHHYYVK